jgi:hypothetical protein
MAVVQGVKEKVHLPIYDSIRVKGEEQLGKSERSNTWKLFVDVQGKTKLETNLQAASLLPHYNTFEARAMRVVISDLPPEFPQEKLNRPNDDLTELPVENDEEPPETIQVGTDGKVVAAGTAGAKDVTADLDLTLNRLMELLKEARESDDKSALVSPDEDGVSLSADGVSAQIDVDGVLDAGGGITLGVSEIEDAVKKFDKKSPPLEQLRPNDGAGNLVSKLIYNTVTTLYVGEKIMIQMPTWFFPAGAGAYSEGAKFITHGEPSPTATFRFAEPIYIDKQQNFRVEIEIPDSDVLAEIQKVYGPMNIWVVLDGYMTRDVQ